MKYKFIKLLVLILISYLTSCNVLKQQEKYTSTKYLIEVYNYFNLAKQPIEGKKAIKYSYEIEVETSANIYKAVANCNVFNFLNSLQGHCIERDFTEKTVGFSFDISEDGKLNLVNKQHIVSQLENNIKELSTSSDSIDLELVSTMNWYLENRDFLQTDILKDLEVIFINDYKNFEVNKTLVNYHEQGVLKSVDFRNPKLNLSKIPHQGFSGVYFDSRKLIASKNQYRRLAITNPSGYKTEVEPNLETYADYLLEDELEIMNLKSGTFRFTERIEDSSNTLLSYNLQLNQDTKHIERKHTIKIRKL